MSFPGGGEGLDRRLSQGRILTIGAVPVYWVLVVFFAKEEGRHFGFLIAVLLPPVAAYVGVRGYREVRPGLTAVAVALAAVTLPLMLGLAMLTGG
ncbi:hypothetical protein ACFV9W_31765 [Streptomyces sp. NPDC059897]|uniref:hypothetical protein n=1 Tax=Streptomyces sp. NPDC059897 TaxID=3346994 RepID=UPI00364D6667